MKAHSDECSDAKVTIANMNPDTMTGTCSANFPKQGAEAPGRLVPAIKVRVVSGRKGLSVIVIVRSTHGSELQW